jgi:DNA-directed RNA polymerase specialized sigma24 family protein
VRVEEGVRRPGVAAEDLVSAVRVHADRVHDAVRRLGVDEQTAGDVVESTAVALVDAVARHPEQVADAVGWWFGRARRLAASAAVDEADLPIGGGVLSADDDQVVLAEALEELAEPDRMALLLRDAYRLPWSAVGAALDVGPDRAAELVARARLRAVPLLDDEPAPPLPAHATDLGVLARLGETAPVAPRDATARRHVQACAACGAVTAAQERVHLLLSGLAVVALPADVRPDVLATVEEHATATLPSAASLVVPAEEWEEWDDDDRSVLSPLLATLGVVVAVLLGTGLGVLLSRGTDVVLSSSPGVVSAATLPPAVAPPPRTLSVELPPPPPIPTPRTTVFFLPPPTTPPPSPTATAAATATPSPTSPSRTTLDVDPSSGREGATLEVTGTGWTPGERVVVDYLDPAGRRTGSRTTATVQDDGTFTASLVARDPSGSPGRHTVRASDGTTTRTAPYDVQA